MLLTRAQIARTQIQQKLASLETLKPESVKDHEDRGDLLCAFSPCQGTRMNSRIVPPRHVPGIGTRIRAATSRAYPRHRYNLI